MIIIAEYTFTKAIAAFPNPRITLSYFRDGGIIYFPISRKVFEQCQFRRHNKNKYLVLTNSKGEHIKSKIKYVDISFAKSISEVGVYISNPHNDKYNRGNKAILIDVVSAAIK